MNSVNWSRLLKRIPVLVLGLAAAALVVRIAWTAWEMTRFEPPQGIAGQLAASDRDGNADAPGSALFGMAPVQVSPGGQPAVLSGGDLQLRGVVASSDQRMAHAIIEFGGVPGAYFPGDTVAAGLSLQEIRSEEVLLDWGGELLRLPLVDLSPGSGSMDLRNLDPNTGAMVNDTADALSEPPRMTLSQIIRMEPVMDADGAMEGYRVFPRAQRALFDSLELVSGDLVVAVNGVSFDRDGGAQARQQMSGGGDMMLSVMRDGEPIEITVGSNNFGLLAM